MGEGFPYPKETNPLFEKWLCFNLPTCEICCFYILMFGILFRITGIHHDSEGRLCCRSGFPTVWVGQINIVSLFIVKVTYFNVLSNSFTILMGSSISSLKVPVPVNLSETHVVIVSVLWNGKFTHSKTSCSTSFHVSWSSYSYRWFLHKFFISLPHFAITEEHKVNVPPPLTLLSPRVDDIS